MAETIAFLTQRGIPVCAHLGLTPQSVNQLGGYRVQGKDHAAAQRVLNDAISVSQAGAGMVVFETIPAVLAAELTSQLTIPTIGIGAGSYCDGQVLVLHDMLGLFERYTPKFVKKYIDLSPLILKAIEEYKDEVIREKFPGQEHTFTIKEEELKKI